MVGELTPILPHKVSRTNDKATTAGFGHFKCLNVGVRKVSNIDPGILECCEELWGLRIMEYGHEPILRGRVKFGWG